MLIMHDLTLKMQCSEVLSDMYDRMSGKFKLTDN